MKFTFDIETIPQRTPLGPAASESLEKKLLYQKDKDEDPEESRRRVMGTSPFFGEIVTIAYQIGDNAPIALIGSEENMLREFWRVLENIGKTIFVSYNGLGFDAPFIIRRSMKYNISASNREFMNLKRFSFYPHFDCYMALSDWKQPNMTISLEQACEFFGIRSSKLGDIKAAQVAQAFADGRIKEIAEYCKRDVSATAEVFEKLAKYYYNNTKEN